MAGGHGGARRNAGRKPGQRIKRTQEIVAGATAGGITPLEYMLEVLRDPQAERPRRDSMAVSAAAFVHPKLNAVATVDASNANCGPLEVRVYAVPRGATIDPKTGLITSPADGSPIEAGPFTPFKPTPSLPELLPAPEPVPAVEQPAPVIDLAVEPAVDSP